MTRYQYVVLTEAVAGREREFEAWYDDQHLADVARVPGVVSATRHRIEKVTSPVETPPWISLAIYEIESDDPDAVMTEIRRRANTDEMPLTDALVGASTLQVLARPTTGG
jgi:hypothetical protein